MYSTTKPSHGHIKKTDLKINMSLNKKKICLMNYFQN